MCSGPTHATDPLAPRTGDNRVLPGGVELILMTISAPCDSGERTDFSLGRGGVYTSRTRTLRSSRKRSVRVSEEGYTLSIRNIVTSNCLAQRYDRVRQD